MTARPATAPSPARRTARRRVCLVSGCAANFFHHQVASLDSLAPLRAREGFDVAIIDLGLEPEQVEHLRTEYDARVVPARWCFTPPARVKTAWPLAFAVRPYTPRLVPGYDVYLWFDADAWMQHDGFYERYVGAAEDGCFAIAREDDPSYGHDWAAMKWHYGNMFAGFGLSAALTMLQHPPLNEGLWAARADHPLWAIWPVMYEAVIRRTGKANLDQHIVHLLAARGEIRTRLMACEDNWICVRRTPLLDADSGLLLSPRTREPLSVLHLAGPDKERIYRVPTLQGGQVERRLTFQQRTAGSASATGASRADPLATVPAALATLAPAPRPAPLSRTRRHPALDLRRA